MKYTLTPNGNKVYVQQGTGGLEYLWADEGDYVEDAHTVAWISQVAVIGPAVRPVMPKDHDYQLDLYFEADIKTWMVDKDPTVIHEKALAVIDFYLEGLPEFDKVAESLLDDGEPDLPARDPYRAR